MEVNKIKVINKKLEAILGEEPLVEFKEPMTELSHEQFYALAKMYSEKGFRMYLENAINSSMRAAATKSDDITSLIYNKSRIILLKELLNITKRAYEDFNKLQKGREKKINQAKQENA